MSHLTRFKQKLEKSRFDSAVITSEVNQRWITGFPYQDGLAVVTPKRAVLITDFRYIEAAKNSSAAKEFEILMPAVKPAEAAYGILLEDGCVCSALEEATLPMSEAAALRDLFDGIEVGGGASQMLDGLREFKDDYEISCMDRAQSIADAAFSHIVDWIRPDMTEKQVALELEFFMRAHGAEAAAFDTIAVSGSASSRPHGVPRDVVLEPGFLTMDFGARIEGYDSDMTRTVVIGKADEDMKRLYNTVLKAQTSVLDVIGPGQSNRHMHMIADGIINEAGYAGCFGHGLGHGVGLYIHEAPRLSQKVPEDCVLLPGQTVTVEPGIYIEGRYGCRIEDMIVIKENGYYNFARSPKELIEIC